MKVGIKETKKRGKRGYPFEKYDIISNLARQFAVNHWHDETEIIYISQGVVDININGKHFSGTEGDIFVINRGEMHEICGKQTPLVYSAFVFDFGMLAFRDEDLAQQKFVEPILKGKMQFHNKPKPKSDIFEILTQINQINEKQSTCFTLYTKALLTEFFSKLIEQGSCCVNNKPDSSNAKQELLKNISEYIHADFSEEITLKEISSEFNMSYKYFCRFFKKHFGKTFVDYLNDVRIENAAKQLESGSRSITDIAISCGFSNMSYFARAFKKRLGCTPSVYRKNF